jgi:hypothetical protein
MLLRHPPWPPAEPGEQAHVIAALERWLRAQDRM